jgi:hypothetical protein
VQDVEIAALYGLVSVTPANMGGLVDRSALVASVQVPLPGHVPVSDRYVRAASRIACVSTTVLLARFSLIWFMKFGTLATAMIPMMASTTINSINVKPACFLRALSLYTVVIPCPMKLPFFAGMVFGQNSDFIRIGC